MSESLAWGRSLVSWARITLVYLMVVTVTGAAVRLTSSGLGCTDWPTCEDSSPIGEAGFHSVVEFGNRVISGLAIVPVIGAYLVAKKSRPDLLIWIWSLVAGFIGQVILGMVVTRAELDPRVVLGHFLLSIVLVALAAALYHGSLDSPAFTADTSVKPRRLRAIGSALVVLGAAVIVVGTLVTGSGPHTGSDEASEPIPRLGFDITEIVRAHSVLVWVLVATILAGLYFVRSDTSSGIDSPRSWLIAIVGMGAVQGAIGYIQYFTSVPSLLVGLHVAGSVVLWTGIVLFALRVRVPKSGDARQPSGAQAARAR